MIKVYRSQAPLRLGIAGGGTDVSPFCDHHGGFVLNATINMFSYCHLEPTSTGEIEFHVLDKGKVLRYPWTSQFALNQDDDDILLKAAHNRVFGMLNESQPVRDYSYRATVHSDAPPGSGLGSSSTMMVAILHAFQNWLNLPLGEYDLAFTAYLAERCDANLSGGRQDQYAAAFGGFNFIEFYEKDRVIVNPLRIRSDVLHELESSLLVYFTGTSRDSAKIINHQRVAAQEPNSQALKALHQVKQDALVMKEMLLRGQLIEMGKYMNQAWEHKKLSSSAISNPHIDQIYEVARKTGAYGGKISGAGGGGFMYFLVDPSKKVTIAQKLMEFGGRVQKVSFTKSGSRAWVAAREAE